MAKRRFGRARAFVRRAASRGARYVRRGTKANRAQLVQIDAMLYGAVRGPISSKVQELVPLPVIGTVGDELAMGLINWMVAKHTSGMIRDIAVKGLVVENARLGESLISMTGLTGSNNNSPAVANSQW